MSSLDLIGEVLGGLIGAIISGGIAIYISRKSINEERIQRNKEKLQDRKDMWLDTHYRDLSEEFNNLAYFNQVRINKEGTDPPALNESFHILMTNLVIYDFKFNDINVEIPLNNVQQVYRNSSKHLEQGYPDKYKAMEELWSAENKYKEELLDNFKNIWRKIHELMKCHFPKLEPSTGKMKRDFDHYNIIIMFETLIEGLANNIEKLEFNNVEGIIYPKLRNQDIIANMNNASYNSFKVNVWAPLHLQFEGKINSLHKNSEELLEREKKFSEDIKDSIT